VEENEDQLEEEESDDDEVNENTEEDENDGEEAENETIPIQGSLFESLDSVPMNPMILKAIDLAAKAHATQLRKGTDTPYISHPTAVGMLLSHYGCSASVVAAGILHDTVEDGDVTLDEIDKIFGPEVAKIVEGCSEPDKSATWIPRKQHTIEYLRTAPRNVKLAAAADKLHNVTSMLTDHAEHGEALWGRFKRGREDQEWYYRGVVESLGGDDFNKHPLYVDLKLAVGKMFDEVSNKTPNPGGEA
jgi:(p)ppGpp synthase/HD superfamily hydrolase